MRSLRSLVLRLAITAALAAATAFAAAHVHTARERPYDVDVVPPPGPLRWASLGHPLLAANLYWLRTVQYIGEPRAGERGWDKLYPLVQLVTDLDPGHGYAYQVAGVVLASAGRIDESNAILEKGTRNVPDRYILPYFRAFNAFYYAGDWPLAGRWAEIAARSPGAPDHIRQNVLAYYVKGQRADAAVSFLEQALRETHDPDSRKALESQLQQAVYEQRAEAIDRAIAAYRQRHGRPPAFLGALVSEGLLPAIPPDPYDGRWELDDQGRIRSSGHAFRYAPPETRAPLAPPGARPLMEIESR